MPRPPHIVFAGGGTPGHLYPGLAVATHLIERIPDALITFIGGSRTLDRHVIRAAGFKFAGVPSQPAPESVLNAVRFVTDNVAGYWAARWFFKEQRVAAVVGLGGASCAPAVRAAISRGLPTFMLEQNVVPGRVTRWLARSVTTVCAGFAETRGYFPTAVPLMITGNPARPPFEQLYRAAHRETRPQHEKRLVVIGGAGGSRSINQSMPGALARLRDRLAGWQIVHQSGEGQLQQTESRYRALGVDALVVAFIDEVAPIMFASDLVVSRSGGTTLAELALASAPAVLVPYRRVMDYQMPNAEVFAIAGAATVIDETDLAGSLEDEFVEHLKPLLSDDALRAKMSASMRRLARPGAAANVTNVVYEALFSNSVRLAA
ncbi:MAG TPA: UDP-N-acetylglucosamine--N-acetylmuramyl-(pentapeptide) pyrophosphoryl-undecaprenol N-acetylglucosamine transferase [Lacipirellulaceae bacterium]|nr:UDP-N-acetylglucosamine--N-acetylmuramyl-(pentapeptide) pyrophosphoryl-undecaprenol N-acetylglucosamine transferase [Lacipirellulaceae bacterium]